MPALDAAIPFELPVAKPSQLVVLPPQVPRAFPEPLFYLADAEVQDIPPPRKLPKFEGVDLRDQALLEQLRDKRRREIKAWNEERKRWNLQSAASGRPATRRRFFDATGAAECTSCGEVLPGTSFTMRTAADGSLYPASRCKSCQSAYRAERESGPRKAAETPDRRLPAVSAPPTALGDALRAAADGADKARVETAQRLGKSPDELALCPSCSRWKPRTEDYFAVSSTGALKESCRICTDEL